MNDISLLSIEEYRAILRNDFATFIERSFRELNSSDDFIPGQYIELLATTLEKCRTGKTKRLIINLPPRTLKSHAASITFPAWLLGHNPAKQIICASYGQDLADKHARDCRTLMTSAFYRDLFPRTTLSREAFCQRLCNYQEWRSDGHIRGWPADWPRRRHHYP
jgi:hypothetical protein